MEVDTSEQSVETLGVMVPNLQQLKLNNSTLKSFRDLGTSLRNLQCLWLSRSGIVDLDGIGALLALKELYVSFNDISDLTPLAMHDELQVLGTFVRLCVHPLKTASSHSSAVFADLDSNRISDMNQIDQLGTCPSLHSITLESNPVCHIVEYRRLVVHHISHLEYLDDEPISDDDRLPVDAATLEAAAVPRPPPPLRSDEYEVDMVADGIKYTRNGGGAARPSTSAGARPGTSAGRRGMAEVNAAPIQKEDHDTGSDLTHGSDVVFAGNLVQAILKRRSHCGATSASVKKGEVGETISDTLDRAAEMETKSREELLSELKAWKLETAVAELATSPFKKQAMQLQRPGTSAGIVNRASASSSSSSDLASTFGGAEGRPQAISAKEIHSGMTSARGGVEDGGGRPGTSAGRPAARSGAAARPMTSVGRPASGSEFNKFARQNSDPDVDSKKGIRRSSKTSKSSTSAPRPPRGPSTPQGKGSELEMPSPILDPA